MTIDEHVRLRLYQWCLDHMEPDLANAMMQAIPPTNWSDLATKTDLDLATRELRSETAELGTSLRGEIAAHRADTAELGTSLRGEMAELGTSLRGEMAELRAETAELGTSLRGEMAELRTDLRTEMAELRTDLRTEMAQARGETQLALASQLRLLVTLILGSTFSLMGLILATSF